MSRGWRGEQEEEEEGYVAARQEYPGSLSLVADGEMWRIAAVEDYRIGKYSCYLLVLGRGTWTEQGRNRKPSHVRRATSNLLR